MTKSMNLNSVYCQMREIAENNSTERKLADFINYEMSSDKIKKYEMPGIIMIRYLSEKIEKFSLEEFIGSVYTMYTENNTGNPHTDRPIASFETMLAYTIIMRFFNESFDDVRSGNMSDAYMMKLYEFSKLPTLQKVYGILEDNIIFPYVLKSLSASERYDLFGKRLEKLIEKGLLEESAVLMAIRRISYDEDDVLDILSEDSKLTTLFNMC